MLNPLCQFPRLLAILRKPIQPNLMTPHSPWPLPVILPVCALAVPPWRSTPGDVPVKATTIGSRSRSQLQTTKKRRTEGDFWENGRRESWVGNFRVREIIESYYCTAACISSWGHRLYLTIFLIQENTSRFISCSFRFYYCIFS